MNWPITILELCYHHSPLEKSNLYKINVEYSKDGVEVQQTIIVEEEEMEIGFYLASQRQARRPRALGRGRGRLHKIGSSASTTSITIRTTPLPSEWQFQPT